MTVYRTFGAGGDYADPSAIWTYLCGIDPLTDNYEFMQVGDCTINNSWPNTLVAANRLDLGRHYLKIYCPWADSHQGDPTKGYKTFLVGAAGEFDINVVNSVVNQDTIILENLFIEQTDASAVNIVRGRDNVSGLGNGANFYLRKLLVKGYSTANGIGIYLSHLDCIYKVSNCKVWNVNTGISCGATATGGALPADNRVEPNKVENCTVYNTGGVGGIQPRNASVNLRFVELRNVVSFGGVRDWNHSIPSQSNTLYNCADEDGSIATAVAAGFQNAINCRGNINPANEFQSLNEDSNFLKLNNGTIT